MFPKVFFSCIFAYLLVGLIRNGLSWKGHRAEILSYIARNENMRAAYFVPWMEWTFHVIFWPFWWPDYKRWRASSKLLSDLRNRARRSATSG
jgi:hypothetical protein